MTYRDVLHRTQHVAAVAVAHPAQFRQKNTAVLLIELATLWIAEAIRLPFFLEAWKISALGKEIFVGALEVFECLLQTLTGRVFQPFCFLVYLPSRQEISQNGIAESSRLVGGITVFLSRQRLVKHETTRTGKAAHIASLSTVGLEFVLIGLQSFHTNNDTWPMKKNNRIRRGRHCAFNMHVHLVFAG